MHVSTHRSSLSVSRLRDPCGCAANDLSDIGCCHASTTPTMLDIELILTSIYRKRRYLSRLGADRPLRLAKETIAMQIAMPEAFHTATDELPFADDWANTPGVRLKLLMADIEGA